MLAMFMGAIEATIVSTAMPAIVADLGGFTLYSWVFFSVSINECGNSPDIWEII
jgi:MFS family permease